MDKNDVIDFINQSVKTLEERYNVAVSFVDALGIFTYNPEFNGLMYELSYHNNPYCNRIKRDEKMFSQCLAAKEKTHQMCRQRKHSFLGVCPHGLCEFVFPIKHKSTLLGCLCVGEFKRSLGFAVQRAKDEQLYNAFPLLPESSTRQALIYDFTALCNMYSYLYAGFSLINESEIYSSVPVNRAIMFIKANYTEQITLTDIAKSCYCNKNYLCSLFYRVTGKHIREYINEVRISQSVHLMRRSNLGITDIALRSGFSSPSYFSTVFKRQMSVTPAEYKLNILKENS